MCLSQNASPLYFLKYEDLSVLIKCNRLHKYIPEGLVNGLWHESCGYLSSFSLYPLLFPFPSTSTIPSWALSFIQQWGVSHVMFNLIRHKQWHRPRVWHCKKLWCGCLQRNFWNSLVCMRCISFSRLIRWNFTLVLMEWLADIAHNGSIPVKEQRHHTQAACVI